jgi:hypothetical protein
VEKMALVEVSVEKVALEEVSGGKGGTRRRL